MVAVAHVLGLMAMIMSLTHLLPIITSLIYGDGAVWAFVFSMFFNFACGLLTWVLARRQEPELQPRDGFLLVTLAWTGGAAFAAVPMVLVMPELSVTDAYFETMSGLTTTGSTVIVGLDHLPPSINLWRHLLQWLGGMGIIVLAVAILPFLGVGGMQLYKAEMPGVYKDKITPRITDTAKSLWMVYAGLTLAAIVALRISGMSWFDAVNHAFSVMALGGFSTHDASIGYFDSPVIEAVLIFFMIVAAINFASHFTAFRERSLHIYLADPEAKAVLMLIAGSCALVALYLWVNGTYASYLTALRYVGFNLVSVATDSGYATTDYNTWPVFATLWMLFLSCITCSTGSTGSGVKMFRSLMLAQQAGRELNRLIHPRLVAPLRFGAHVVPNDIVSAILAFVFVYFIAIVGLTFVLLISGLELLTAFSAVIAWINNLGPGLSEVGPATNFAGLTTFQKWVGIVTMLLGRLELFTVLVLFSPGFWRS